MTLSAAQMKWAKAIVAECKVYPGLGDTDHRERACDIALATALVESGLKMYANGNNRSSMQLPHDAVGWDHGSVGLFQQQVGGAPNSTANWGTVAELMNATTSTARFLRALVQFKWTAMTNGAAAQRVQGSAYPDRYAARDAEAVALRKSLWGGTPTPSPVKPPAKPPAKPASHKTYAVVAGDNLSTIGHKFGVTVGQIVAWNKAAHPSLGTNLNHIEVGWVLRVSA